jgi:hypothetical protein
MRFLTLIMCIALIAGCSGQIYTIVDPESEDSKKIKGVITYLPQPLVLVYETTQLHDKDGNVIGKAEDGSCLPVELYEIVSIPDYTKKYAVVYEPGLFETNKFGLELDKGVVTKINTESSSVAKESLAVIQSILGTAKELKGLYAKEDAARMAVPACNAGKKIKGRIEISDIPSGFSP